MKPTPKCKKQHYLPAVYLKQFSADGAKAKRSSLIWRFDQQRSVRVPVESQCAGDYFYSRRDSQGAEETFHGMEGAYGSIAQKIWSWRDSTQRDFFGLILMMLDLHCRNVCYANRTREENVHAYQVRIHCLRNEILMGENHGPVSDLELLKHMRAVWRVKLLGTTKGNELVTSDNPAHLFTLNDVGSLHFVVMPVTPFYCAVAFDSRFCRATGSNLTSADESALNLLQALNCWECLFTLSALSNGQQEFAREKWKGGEKSLGYVDEREWSMTLKRQTDRDCFSFLTPV